MIQRRFIILLLVALSVWTLRAAEVVSADAMFTRASELADTDLTQARELYRVAALHYLAEAQAQPSRRGALLYNAGNAFFLAGDPGQAVVSYRRAEPYLPGSTLLRDNLAFVRQQSGNPPEIPPSGWLTQLRFWQWHPATQWIVFLGAVLWFWLGLFRRQWTGRSWPGLLSVGTAALAVLMAGTLGIRYAHNASRCRGVLVSSQVVARKGPNYGYAPAFTAPLDAGLECDIIGRQGDWLHVSLADQQECWVRTGVVEIWKEGAGVRNEP